MLKKKLQCLPYLHELVNKQSYILEEVTTDTRIYKLGIANFDFTLLLEEIVSTNFINIPVSLRINSFLTKAKNFYTCEFVFYRTSDRNPYSEYSYSLYSKTQIAEKLKDYDDTIKNKININNLKKVQV